LNNNLLSSGFLQIISATSTNSKRLMTCCLRAIFIKKIIHIDFIKITVTRHIEIHIMLITNRLLIQFTIIIRHFSITFPSFIHHKCIILLLSSVINSGLDGPNPSKGTDLRVERCRLTGRKVPTNWSKGAD